ncbi:MAG TPA: dolichyl-phosphate beta-glucosyltransferase [Candidatus Paceibacterota bacterium]|nr:dolichyl-phosphate beta-glucosyltransferase [Candidatus Paceibacterota bacterium]
MSQPYLSIIIPAYNEAERIPKTLLAMDKQLEHAAYSYEIVVVNDGSKDNTAAIVKNLAKAVRNLKLIDLKDNAGKGGAVRQGMLLSAGQVRLFTDADNSTSIDQFEKMMPYLKEGYEVVIGSRAVKGAELEPPEPFVRQVIGKALNLIVQILLLPGIWDTQCGFKAFTQDAAGRIFHAATVTGWGFDVEALALARRMGYRTREMPVRWVNDARSHVRFSSGLQFLKDIAIIRWRLWWNEYK